MLSILWRKELREYDFGAGHPVRGSRHDVFSRFLPEHLPEQYYRSLAAEPAGDADLQRICDADYIEFTREFYRAANLGLAYDGRFSRYHSPDNRPGRGPGKIEEAARLIVGQAKLACDLVWQRQSEKAVSIGGGLHHARRSYGEGFCLYNDVAFAATYLLESHGLKRVLVLDTDAHAGNGTGEYFYRDPCVLFIDLHQDPRTLYPGTGFAYEIGEGAGRGYTVNVPLPMFAGYDSYRLVFEDVVRPLAEEFVPEVIIRNGGSDPYFNDSLTSLGLPLAGFRMIGEEVARLADGLCGGRVIDLIASGYNESVLPYAWLALLCGLGGIQIPIEEPEPVPARFRKDLALEETKRVIAEVKNNLKGYWRCFR